MDIRNVAIIAHVDHGKTTLVDQLLAQGGAFRENQSVQERVMDSNDLERERGITILAKNTSVNYKGTHINVVDTPGHADFGGEVERILKMVNGVLLLVDAAEGPMPQTRFVLGRALELGHPVIVVVNKIDKPDARIYEVCDEVLSLLIDLDATEAQIESPMLFCSARMGTCSITPEQEGADLIPLFETILSHIPAPTGDATAPLQLLVSAIDYNEYVGRIGIGRVERGTLRVGGYIVCNALDEGKRKQAKVVNLYRFEGLKRVPVESAEAGEIVAFSGIEDVTIGDTVCDSTRVQALPFSKISEPTVEMTFCVNDSPFAGQEGKYVTSRNLRDRLQRELLKDVSLRVRETDSAEAFIVAARGEMHLSILIETMRREGYEFQVSPPRVLYQDIDGVRCEPMERLTIDLPEESVGVVMEKMGNRKGELLEMTPVGSRMRLIFVIPARGLFGYRSEFLSDTRGEGVLNTYFEGYAPFKGELSRRSLGSMVSFETGDATSYGLYGAQDRGALLIEPACKVYAGMLVGICNKPGDIVVNICKRKQMTNKRSSGNDEALRLVPIRKMSMEMCLEFMADDELMEVTPSSLRLRKRVLSHEQRMKMESKKNK